MRRFINPFRNSPKVFESSHELPKTVTHATSGWWGIISNGIKSNWIFITILLLAAFFRFWQIGNLPGGLFPDEAANGLDVNSILSGKLQPFYERGNGREALFFYMIAFVVMFFGRGPWQHHVVSAGVGFLEVFVTYFLVKRMFGKRAAQLATFFMAISSYMVTMNRTAFRANLVPLFTTLTIFFLVRLFQSTDFRQKIYNAIFAGISFGLGFYTYISYRMMIPLLFGLGLILILAFRSELKNLIKPYLKMGTAFVLAFLFSFGPLLYYFISHPGSFVGRAGQVSIFSESLNNGDVLGTFITVFKQTMLGFFTQGDLNWRHNVAGFPFLSPFLSPFFAVALIIFTFALIKILKQIWQKNLDAQTFYQVLVVSWFWLLMVPEITTAEGIPHGLRLVGVIPPMFILPAWLVSKVWDKISQYIQMVKVKTALIGIFAASLIVYNYNLYFVIAANSPDYYYAFRSDLTTVSNYLNKRNDKARTYLSLDEFSVQTVEYLTTPKNQPYILVDPAHTYEVSLKNNDQVVFTQSTIFDIAKFTKAHPEAKIVKSEKNQFNQLIMTVYQK